MSVKISELPILDSLADNDVIAGVDTSANVTSKIEMVTLKNYIDTNTQYTAGTNIDITNNVVSAPNVYNKTETDGLIDNLETSVNEQLEEKDEQIEELQSEVDSLSTIYNAFPTESGEGESLTLDDTAEVKFKKFNLKGNTSQTTYSGKNLLPNNGTTLTRNGMTFTVNDDGSYTLNGTTTSATDYNICQAGELQLEAGTYTLSSTTNIPSGMWLSVYEGTSDRWAMTGTNTKTMTVSTATTNAKGHFYINNGVTLNNLRIYPMIVSGTTVGDYEPYTGKTPSPNPSYPQPVNVVSGDNEINVCGKNILDLTGITSRSSNGITITPNFNGDLLQNIKVSGTPTATNWINMKNVTFEAGTYIISGLNISQSGKTGLRIGLYFDSARQYFISVNSPTYTFTLQETATAQFVIWVQSVVDFPTTDTYVTPMIRLSSETDDTYEPYQGNTYNIDLPEGMELCKIGNYQDYFYKDSDKWYLHKEIGKVVLNGSESGWNYQNGCFTLYDIPNIIKTSAYGDRNQILVMSDYFKAGLSDYRSGISATNYQIAKAIDSNGTQIAITFNDYTSISDFTTWLSTHNLSVKYVLQTPTTEEITYQSLIDQLNLLEKAMSKDSQTNISQVNNDLGFIIYAEAIKSLENVLDRIELLES